MAELNPCPTCGVAMPDGDCESCYPTPDTNKPLTPAILKRVIEVAYQFENEVQDFNVAMQQDAFLHNWAAPAIVQLNQLVNQYRTLYYEQNKQADQQYSTRGIAPQKICEYEHCEEYTIGAYTVCEHHLLNP